jgi:RNA polymerase sigma-70 factor (ECF subfamily)
VALNRAVALAEVEGAQAALAVVDRLPLDSYYLAHAVRADLLARLGRPVEAAVAYETARRLTDNESERTFLERAQAAAAGSPGR